MSLSASTVTAGLADRLPPQAPSHLYHILNDLDEADRTDAPNSALKAMREAFAFLLGHFTDLTASTALSFGASAELFAREEDDLISVSECETRLREGLHLLSEQIEKQPIARALCTVFFDLDTGTQRTFYLLSQGGTVGGGLGLKRLSDFCKPPARPPSRSEAFKTVSSYRSHLLAFLEMAGRFWEQCKVLDEHTSLKARQRIRYRFGDFELSAGMRCDLHGCLACIPSRVIKVPAEFLGTTILQGFPSNVPEHSLHLIDRFCEALASKSALDSTRLMRDTFEFLLRYFAGIAKTLCDTLDLLPEAARKPARDTESVDNCERLLQLCVEALKPHQDDPAARAIVGVFYRRTASLELEPRSHTGILLLEGVLSSWFKRERGQEASEERSKSDFERFFPLLRDWLGAMYPYFAQCEHFEEPPTLDGHLPLTVKLGDHLLELIAPAYTLRIRQCPVCLPNPSWLKNAPASKTPAKASAGQIVEAPAQVAQVAQVAKAVEPEEPKATPGEFRPVEPAPDSPKFLLRMVRRLDVYVRRGEAVEARAALCDTLDYLVRYWAGVAEAVARQSGTLSPDLERLAEDSLSIQQCERLLNSCLQGFPTDASPAAQEVVTVFYELDVISDELKPAGSHARMLKMDADASNKMQLLAEFCENKDVSDIRRARADLKTFLPVLRDWLARSQSFFEQCQHHEEEPDASNRMELVVQFDQTYLELVAPDYVFYVRAGSDVVPDLPVPEWVEPEEPEEIKVEKKQAVIRPEDLAMAEPFLIHRVNFVGTRPNSKGVVCKSGKIKIENAGGGSLTGRAFSNHPCIEVSPARFRDNSQLDYWLDEKSVPRDFIPTLTLRSGGDERIITLAELRPVSSLTTLTKAQVLALLYAPAVSFYLILMFTFLSVRGDILRIFRDNSINISALKSATLAIAVNDEQLVNLINGKAQMVGWPFIALPVLSGCIVFYLFRRLSPVMQDLVIRHFDIALIMPSVIGLFIVTTGILGYEVSTTNAISALNWVHLFPWVLIFNAGMWVYAQLSFRNKFAEWVPDQNLRKLIGPVFFVAFIALSTLPLVY